SLTYGFDGRLVAGGTPGDLTPLEMLRAGPLLFARSQPAGSASLPAAAWDDLTALVPRPVVDFEAAADWKVLVETWVERLLGAAQVPGANQLPRLSLRGP